VTDHNRVLEEPLQRSAFVRAARTNNPMALPAGLSRQDARRYRDLIHEYAGQVGAERMKYEDTQARVPAVVWLTVELERLQGERLCDRPVPLHTVLHMTQELRTLLQELELNGTTKSFGCNEEGALRGYLEEPRA
jgi:hypothetical protein